MTKVTRAMVGFALDQFPRDNRLTMRKGWHATDDQQYVAAGVQRPLHELLDHLYVLIPVLDNDKYYWLGSLDLSAGGRLDGHL